MAIKLKNLTRFPAHCAAGGRAPLALKILNPEPFQWMLQVVVKATYCLGPGGWRPDPQPLALLERSGETENGYMEGDLALEKQGADLVVMGDAIASASELVPEMEVKISVGPWGRSLHVIGDRVWVRRTGSWYPSNPIPFRTMPMGYERSFGGTYKLVAGGEMAYSANPIGKGWTPFLKGIQFAERPLPNIEDPIQRVVRPEQEAEPKGFQWYRMDWALRILKGVEAANDSGPPKPLPRLWNGAHPDLVLESYPKGASVQIEGMTPNGVFECLVPDIPVCLEHSLNGARESLPAKPDTLCLFPAKAKAYCLARWLIPFEAATTGSDTEILLTSGSADCSANQG